MASVKPIVQKNGLLQQLQAGDTLSVPTSEAPIIQLTNGESGAITICQVVYISAADTVKKAKADASGTTFVIGLVADASISASTAGSIQVGNIFTATTAQWDAVAGTTGGLTQNTIYYLSDTTAGSMSATAPSTVGHYVNPIGIALSTTELKLFPSALPILL